MPKTLVAMVGTNPLPVLLSCLSHTAATSHNKINRIVLAHSTKTATPTRRIARAISELLPERVSDGSSQSKDDSFSIEMACIGDDVSTIDTIRANLAAALADKVTSGKVVLDYTGGTSAMTVAAVNWHIGQYDDAEASAKYRTYVDDTAGRMRFDDETRNAQPLYLPKGYNLRMVAKLHGYKLDDLPEKSDDLEKQTFEAMEEIVRLHTAQLKSQGCDRCAGWGIDKHTCGGAIGEVLCNQNAFRIISDADGDLAAENDATSEFDVLVRWGHRVLAVEAKGSTRRFAIAGGWIVSRAEAVFGSACRVWMLTGDGVHNQIEAAMKGPLEKAGAVIAVKKISNLKTQAKSRAGGLHWVFPKPGGAPAKMQPLHDDEAGDNAVVSAVGGGRMGPFAALSLARAEAGSGSGTAPVSDVHLLVSAQYQANHPSNVKSLVQTVTAFAADVAPHLVRGMDLGSAAMVRAVTNDILKGRQSEQPMLLDVTSGTKAATAGMTAAGYEYATKAEITIAATDLRQRRRSMLGKGDSVSQAVTDLPWEQIFATYPLPLRRLDQEFPGQTKALEPVINHLATRIGVPEADLPRWVFAEQLINGEEGAAHEPPLVFVPARDRLLAFTSLPQVALQLNANEAEPEVPEEKYTADVAATALACARGIAGDASYVIAVYECRSPEEDTKSELIREKILKRLRTVDPDGQHVAVCLLYTDKQLDFSSEAALETDAHLDFGNAAAPTAHGRLESGSQLALDSMATRLFPAAVSAQAAEVAG